MAFLNDLRYSLRLLRRSPTFTLTVLVVLALGMSAAIALFSVCDAVLLRPLPYSDLEALVSIDSTRPGRVVGTASWLEFQEWRRASKSFAGIGGYMQSEMDMMQGGYPVRVPVTAVTANAFAILGVRPVMGRLFQEGEDGRGAPRTAVLSYALWKQEFQGSKNVLGRTLTLDQEPREIIGVAPPDFELPFRSPSVAWIPFDPANEMFTTPGMHFINAIARLKPGISMEQARQDMRQVADYTRQLYPKDNKNRSTAVQGLRDAWTGAYRTQLELLLGAVFLLLVMACSNVANLLLAHGSVRSYETAVRIAVGASQGRLLRLFLTESVLLAVGGGICGTALGWALLQMMQSSLKTYVPEQKINLFGSHTVVFLVAIVLASASIFGLLPAWNMVRKGVTALRDPGVGKIPFRERLLRSSLVVSEIAVSVMLLAGAGLLIRTMRTIQHLTLGISVERVLSLKVSPAEALRAQGGDAGAFYKNLLSQLHEAPGIEAAGMINNLPLSGPGMNSTFLIPGRIGVHENEKPEAEIRIISDGYYDAMGVSLLRGRKFRESDTLSSQPVAIINETAMKTFFAANDPVGQQIQLDQDSPKLTVVGVVTPTRQRGATDTFHAEIDLPFSQLATNSLLYRLSLQREMSLVVRSSLPLADVLAAIRGSVEVINPEIPIYEVQSMREVVSHSVRGQEFAMRVFVFFAVVALLVGGFGIYGVTAYLVTQRTHEIGIRMALGATRTNIVGMVVKHSLLLSAIGVGLGLTGFLILGKALTALLYGVSYLDLSTLAVTAGALAFVGIIACCVPAYRAMMIAPTIALRQP